MINILLKAKNILGNKDSKKLFILAFSKLFLGILEIVSVLSFIPFLSLISNPNYINESDKILFIKENFNLGYDKIIILVAVIPFTFIILVNIFRLYLSWWDTKTQNDLWHKVHCRLFEYYIKKEYLFHIKNTSNELMERLVVRANMALTTVIIPSYQIIGNTLLAVILIGGLIFYNPVMAILTFIMIIFFYLILFQYFKKKMDNYGKFAPEFSQKIFKLVEESLKSIKSIKVGNYYDLFYNQYKENTKKYTSNSTYLNFFISTPRTVTEFFGYSFALITTLFLLFVQKQDLSNVLVILGIYLITLQKLIPVVQDFFLKFSSIKVNRFSLELMEEDLINSLKLENKNKEKKEIKKIKDFSKILINNSEFKYEDNKNFKITINNLTIKKNDLIGISGKSGSGKSTLLNILAGLIFENKININLDDQFISEKDLLSYQTLIEYVPQNIFILNDTILRNIAFGLKDEEINYERVKVSAKLSCIDYEIQNEMPNNYQTIVGENAIKLSGGQRQRIGIARALYSNKKVLILDEATNSLDKKNEQTIIENIINLKNRTIIIVTHNSELLKKLNRILMIDRGKILEKIN